MAATFIGALLFVIPGIIAGIYLGYSFSMTFYILADHPEYGPWAGGQGIFPDDAGAMTSAISGWNSPLSAGRSWRPLPAGSATSSWSPNQNAAYAIFYLELAGDYFAFRAANPEVRY